MVEQTAVVEREHHEADHMAPVVSKWKAADRETAELERLIDEPEKMIQQEREKMLAMKCSAAEFEPPAKR